MPRNAKAFTTVEMRLPGAPGAICFVQSVVGKIIGWNHACPCGCGAWSYMCFDPDMNTPAATWQIMSGSLDDLERLSLMPSIGIKFGADRSVRSDGFHWHGYLKNGVFEEL